MTKPGFKPGFKLATKRKPPVPAPVLLPLPAMAVQPATEKVGEGAGNLRARGVAFKQRRGGA